jgi:hypothetical protein
MPTTVTISVLRLLVAHPAEDNRADWPDHESRGIDEKRREQRCRWRLADKEQWPECQRHDAIDAEIVVFDE